MMPGAPVMPGLQIQGERQSGQDVRTQNVTAVLAVANIVRTSLGPVGLDKVSQIAGARLHSSFSHKQQRGAAGYSCTASRRCS